jgi:hypothetical protein
MTKAQLAEQAQARETLRGKIKPSETIYTVLKHVSRSGMYRVVDVFRIVDDQPLRISYIVAQATGLKYDRKHEGVGVSGCGMDMGFEVVYTLGQYLFPDGFECTGDGTRTNDTGEWCLPCCRSNDHSNGDRNFQPHKHSSGGYALRHQWL